MKITRVEIEGVRSWEKLELNFNEEFLAIIGPKGAGKTSIAMAIEFALFGEKTPLSMHGYTPLIREGVSRCSVKLEFEHNGHRYLVSRALVRRRGRVEQDPSETFLLEDGRVIAREKATRVTEEVETRTGISNKLFRATCYVPQEQLKFLINLQPSKRKEIIDELLGLKELNKAHEIMRELIKEREGRVKVLRDESLKYDVKKLQREYNNCLRKLEEKRSLIKKLEVKEKELRDKLAEVEIKLEELKRKSETVERLKKEISDVIARKTGLEATLKELREAVNQTKNSLDRLREEERKIKDRIEELWTEARNSGYKGDLEVEKLGKEVKLVEKEVEDVVTKVASLKTELIDLEEKERKLKGKTECPLCGAPLNAELTIKIREERVRRIKHLKREVEELGKKEKELRRKLDTLRRVKEELLRVEEEVKRVNEAKREYEKRLSELNNRIRLAEKELDMVNKEVERLNSQLRRFGEVKSKEVEELREKLMRELNGVERELEKARVEVKYLSERLDSLSEDLERGRNIKERLKREERILRELTVIRSAIKDVLPRIRKHYVKVIESYVQSVLPLIYPEAPFMVEIDENYTPIIKYAGYTRSIDSLSGGERTLIALAYRIGLGNAVFEARTGRPVELLILDEPTENLGNEDGSIENLAKALASLKQLRQVIAITHSTVFSRYADRAVQVEKRFNTSRVVS